MTNEWKLAIDEVQQVLQTKLGMLNIPNGKYELELSEVPQYAALRGTYNKEYERCPVIVYNDHKWNVEYYQNDVLAVGFWETFSLSQVESEWVEKTQRAEVKKTNADIEGAETLEQKINIAVRHNHRGLSEGWLSTKDPLNAYKINMSPFKDEVKVSKSSHCNSSMDINVHYPSLNKEDIPFLKKMLLDPKYWWREYEKIKLWNTIYGLMGRPDPRKSIILDEVLIEKIETMPPLSALNLLSFEGEYSDCFPKKNRFFSHVSQPKEFESLLEFIRKGFENGVISEGYSYNTVRFDSCHTGAVDHFKFTLSLNGRVYEVDLYGSDRGGNAERPSRYGKDLTVNKMESCETVDIICDIPLNNDVIFRNIARLLGANYPFRNSGIPIAGII